MLKPSDKRHNLLPFPCDRENLQVSKLVIFKLLAHVSTSNELSGHPLYNNMVGTLEAFYYALHTVEAGEDEGGTPVRQLYTDGTGSPLSEAELLAAASRWRQLSYPEWVHQQVRGYLKAFTENGEAPKGAADVWDDAVQKLNTTEVHRLVQQHLGIPMLAADVREVLEEMGYQTHTFTGLETYWLIRVKQAAE